ncbi:TPA: phosphate-starvation-inducible PsiE family protein [Pseudomonas aeruginosa]
MYIAITALTRYLIGDVSHHKAPDVGLIYLCGGVFLLSLSVLAVRYASYKFPSSKAIDASGEVIGEQVLDK